MHTFKRFLLMILFGSLMGCTTRTPDQSRVPLLEVEGKFLYLDQLDEVIPSNINAADSIQLADSYIKKWVTDILLYENAKRNVTDKAEIDKLLEDYKKSLIIHQYQQNLIQQRLRSNPSEEEMYAFYQKFSGQLLLKENLIKGMLLILPAGAPKVTDVRKWVQKGDVKSLELIEKYSLQHGLSYDYFADRWIPLSEISKQMPAVQQESLTYALGTNKFFETSDSLKQYMLKIDSVKRVGELEPFETGKDKIAYLIMNKLKTEFITNFEDELYNDAVQNGIVKFFKK